jgi:hypothetical protein
MPVMTKLIGCNTIDFKGLDSTHGARRFYGSRAHGTQPDEPIFVQVRVRQYADRLPEVRQSGNGNRDFGRMPVGTILDCYV